MKNSYSVKKNILYHEERLLKATEKRDKIKMVNFKDKKIGEGKGSIALQIHSGGDLKIRWRNIKLEKL